MLPLRLIRPLVAVVRSPSSRLADLWQWNDGFHESCGRTKLAFSFLFGESAVPAIIARDFSLVKLTFP